MGYLKKLDELNPAVKPALQKLDREFQQVDDSFTQMVKGIKQRKPKIFKGIQLASIIVIRLVATINTFEAEATTELVDKDFADDKVEKVRSHLLSYDWEYEGNSERAEVLTASEPMMILNTCLQIEQGTTPEELVRPYDVNGIVPDGPVDPGILDFETVLQDRVKQVGVCK